MNQAVTRGLIAAMILVAAMVPLWLIISGGEADWRKPAHMFRAGATITVVFGGLAVYALVRSLRSGTLYVTNRFCSAIFHRQSQPAQYWSGFAVYCLLVAFILTAMIWRLVHLWPFI